VLVVASEGEGAQDLAAAAAGRRDVRMVGYQPAERFSEVLSSADAVLALLEPEASRFSVPSKVLSYLSAGRPIVALVPAENQAAGDVRQAGGFVGTPDAVGARQAADWLAATYRQSGRLATIGVESRALAEKRFDIGRIADEFERSFARALDSQAPRTAPSRSRLQVRA
jgi:glycosyltransferase involved in cell wall biosynthesis